MAEMKAGRVGIAVAQEGMVTECVTCYADCIWNRLQTSACTRYTVIERGNGVHRVLTATKRSGQLGASGWCPKIVSNPGAHGTGSRVRARRH